MVPCCSSSRQKRGFFCFFFVVVLVFIPFSWATATTPTTTNTFTATTTTTKPTAFMHPRSSSSSSSRRSSKRSSMWQKKKTLCEPRDTTRHLNQQTTTTTIKMSSSEGIGFIGLGIMGEGMAARLLSEGIAGTSEAKPLVIWNRTGSKCIALKKRFADSGKHVIIKKSPKEVVEACKITYSMLSTPEVSKLVFEGETGVLAGISEGKSIVDCATLAEEDMKSMEEAVREKGGRFLEAPVSGSKVPAAMGTLIFLCAGNEELYKDVKENGLKVMGKSSYYFSQEVGYGTRAKLVINSLMGTMVAAYSESLVLSEAIGLDVFKIIEVIGQSAISSPVYTLKGPKMVSKDHETNFPLKHAHKDMKLASDMAKKAQVEFTVNDKATELFNNAREDTDLNVADKDFSAIVELVHKNSNNELSRKRKYGK